MKLYMTESGPNGTNALLLVNEENIVIEAIEEACFGHRIKWSATWSVLTPEGFIDSSSFYSDDELVELCIEAVEPVSWSTVLEKLACNPFDPSGEKKLKEIKEALRRHMLIAA